MSWNKTKSTLSNIAFSVLFITTITLSVGFWMFLGKESDKENIESFKNYLVKEGVEVVWNEKDHKLFIKHNNIELNQIKDFKMMKSLSYKPNEINTLKFSFEGVDDIQNKLFFGNPLKEELTQIKVIVNNIDNEELMTQKYLASIYEKYYPYKIAVCDMDSHIYLNEKLTTCPEGNHINLIIDTVSKSFNMNISYYKDWGGIASRYLTYSTTGMERQLADFKAISNDINNKFGDDIAKLRIEKIYGSNIIVNGEVKKTVRNLDTEFLAIVDDKKDYIEKDVGEIYFYVAFTKNNAVDDFTYIIRQLQNKSQAKTKLKELPIESQTEPVTKTQDKSVKPVEDVKPEVMIDQLEKDIKANEIKNVSTDVSKPIETKPISDIK